MSLPQANILLFFLSAFTGLWGLSVILRGIRTVVIPGLRRCPECKHDMRTTQSRVCPDCAFESRTESSLQPRTHDWKTVIVGTVAACIGLALIPVAVWVRHWESTGYDDTFDLHPIQAAFYGVAAFGLALIVWAWRGDRAKGRRRCPRCWYDMRATIANSQIPAAQLLCPECGHEPPDTRALYRSRRRPKIALLGIGVLLIGLYAQTIPRALSVGVLGLVPTSVLIGGMQWLPESWYFDAARTRGATLESRLVNGELWGWQRRWAASKARAACQQGWGARRPTVVIFNLDRNVPEQWADGVDVFLQALADPSYQPTAAQCRDLLRIYRPLLEDDSPGIARSHIQDTIKELSPGLLQRAATTGSPLAPIFSSTLVVAGRNSAESVAILGVLARDPNAKSTYVLGNLARVARNNTNARQEILGLLKDDNALIRMNGVNTVWAMGWDEPYEDLFERVFELAIADTDPAVCRLAARVIWRSGAQRPFAERLVAEPNLSFEAKEELLILHSYHDPSYTAFALPVAESMLQAEDKWQVSTGTLFLLEWAESGHSDPDTIERLCTPLLEHPDPNIQRDAEMAIYLAKTVTPKAEIPDIHFRRP